MYNLSHPHTATRALPPSPLLPPLPPSPPPSPPSPPPTRPPTPPHPSPHTPPHPVPCQKTLFKGPHPHRPHTPPPPHAPPPPQSSTSDILSVLEHCFKGSTHALPASLLPRTGLRGRRHWRQPLNRATPYVAAAHSPSSAMGQTAVPPTPLHRTSVSPRALLGTLSFRRRVFAGNPHHRRGFPVPQAAPPKSIMSTVLPNTPFPKPKERMLGCWGGPEAGIRARIMSISRALGAETP